MNKNFTIETFDEYPEFTQENIDCAVFKIAGKTVDKATWQRHVKKTLKKQRISIALDPDVIEFFKNQAGERGYQTLINQTLRQVMLSKS